MTQLLNFGFLVTNALALLAGLWRLRQPGPRWLSWIVAFLAVSLAVEVAGILIAIYLRNNLWLYNLWVPLEFAFYPLLFSQVYKNRGMRLAARAFIPAYLLFALINLLFIQGYRDFASHTTLLGCMSAVVFAGAYLYQLFLYPDAPLRSDPLFWISVGLILFYAANMLYLGSFNYFLKHHLQTAILLKGVMQATYALFFTVFIFGFIWSAKPLRYSSPS